MHVASTLGKHLKRALWSSQAACWRRTKRSSTAPAAAGLWPAPEPGQRWQRTRSAEVKQLFWHIEEAVTERTQFTTQPRVQTQNTVERGRSPEVGGHWESWLSSEGRGTLGQAGQGWEKSAQSSTVSYNSMPLKSWAWACLTFGKPPKETSEEERWGWSPGTHVAGEWGPSRNPQSLSTTV